MWLVPMPWSQATDLRNMNRRVKPRLIALAAGIGLMGLAIACTIVEAQRQVVTLRARLNRVDDESFHIADQFRELLRKLNDSLYRYGSDHHPADLQEFLKASDDLNQWIDRQKPKLKTEQENDLMQQIDNAYDDYLAAAKELQIKPPPPEGSSATMAEFAPLMEKSRRLFELGQALAKAHYGSRAAVLSDADRVISGLHVLELISLSCLLAFGVALALVIYRGMIAPLRTRLVESQALVERHEKLASLGMLAAGVAHEIRNPLTAIKAALFIQQKKFLPGTQEFADAEVVGREILRLEKIVNDFLLFARPADPQLASITADMPLREVHALLAPQLARNNIRLLLEPAPPLRIQADPAQIKQVLINLVQNAADAVSRDGVVKLRARRDRKRLANSETNVAILEVEDNGKGIPPEVQQRLFDPFFTTKDSGTGLGLSIAAGIIQKHSGTLQYQTRVNHGTTFGIVLPVDPGDTAKRAD